MLCNNIFRLETEKRCATTLFAKLSAAQNNESCCARSELKSLATQGFSDFARASASANPSAKFSTEKVKKGELACQHH